MGDDIGAIRSRESFYEGYDSRRGIGHNVCIDLQARLAYILSPWRYTFALRQFQFLHAMASDVN